MLESARVAGKFYAQEQNPSHSGAWPELHVFDSAEERDEFISRTRCEKDLSRADKVAMTQRGEKHWFRRKAVSESDALAYVDKCADLGPSGTARVIVHHRLDPAQLAAIRAEQGLDATHVTSDETSFDDVAASQAVIDNDAVLTDEDAVVVDAE